MTTVASILDDLTADLDPVIPVLAGILDELRQQSPRILTDKGKAQFIRNRLTDAGFEIFEVPGGLGR